MDQNNLICRKVETVIAHHPASSQHGGEAAAAPVKPSQAPVSSPLKGRRRTALIWSVGGTIFSAVGFIALALFEQYNDSLSELRHDLNHFNEISGNLVKKENLRRFRDHLKKCYEELLEAKEARLLLQKELQGSETAKKEIAGELQRLRERLASVEGHQAAAPIVIQVPMPGRN